MSWAIPIAQGFFFFFNIAIKEVIIENCGELKIYRVKLPHVLSICTCLETESGSHWQRSKMVGLGNKSMICKLEAILNKISSNLLRTGSLPHPIIHYRELKYVIPTNKRNSTYKFRVQKLSPEE